MKSDEPAERILLVAAAFAAEHHRGQRRKDHDATPYINHPLQVAAMLASAGGVTDVDTLVAALLHDTVEDTDVTPEDIEERFGPVVRGYVEEVTDDKSLPSRDRKRLQIEGAPGKSLEAARIKLADKICNVRDLGHHPPVGWPVERVTEYFDWAEQVIDALPPCNPALVACFKETVIAGRRRMADHP